jgi:RNA ligase
MLNDLIENGYISKRKHPEEKLFILNYTPKTQYERVWNEWTRKCRGLIINDSGDICSRCFEKFFNYEEVKSQVQTRLENRLEFSISEKVDGSLGILYWVRDKPFISTRGSFESKQAIRATKILHEKYSNASLSKDLTYLFEIIYPDNRICVDYGQKEDLIFLAAFDTKSGLEVDPGFIPFNAATKYRFESDFDTIKSMNTQNQEGFVVRFEDGFRFKIKFDDYVLMHDTIFSISTKSIWRNLKNNQEVPTKMLPQGVRLWADNIVESMTLQYNEIEKAVSDEFSTIKQLPRKEFADRAKGYSFPHLLFAMLDNKPYKDIIWKILEPEYKVPDEEI